MRNDLSARAKEIALEFTSWPSVTGTQDEVAIAQKIGAVETAADFLARRTGGARPADMLPYLQNAKPRGPRKGDEMA